jgi:hypothetical protein
MNDAAIPTACAPKLTYTSGPTQGASEPSPTEDEPVSTENATTGPVTTNGANSPVATQVGASTSHAGNRRPHECVNARMITIATISIPAVTMFPPSTTVAFTGETLAIPIAAPAIHASLRTKYGRIATMAR